MARPRKPVDVIEVLRLRLEGFSWPCIARQAGLGYGTIYRAYRGALARMAAVQNPKTAKIHQVANPETDQHALHERHHVNIGAEELNP